MKTERKKYYIRSLSKVTNSKRKAIGTRGTQKFIYVYMQICCLYTTYTHRMLLERRETQSV